MAIEEISSHSTGISMNRLTERLRCIVSNVQLLGGEVIFVGKGPKHKQMRPFYLCLDMKYLVDNIGPIVEKTSKDMATNLTDLLSAYAGGMSCSMKDWHKECMRYRLKMSVCTASAKLRGGTANGQNRAHLR